MKIAKVLMIVLAVSLCCATANAQNDCATALTATCNGSVVLDPAADLTPTGPHSLSCEQHVCSDFSAACTSDADCPAGITCLGINDVWATFVATDVSARLQTDVNSVGTDSNYTVYSVTQANVCDSAGWTEIGCSGDEGAGFLGDISIGGLTVGDTYLIQMGHWADAYTGSFQLDISCPTVGTVCGDGIISLVPGQEECDGAATGDCILTCDPDCTCTPVPTPMLPKWGLVGLALMLIVGGAAVFGRGRMGVQQA